MIASCSDSASKVSYTLTATLSPLGGNIFTVPVVNQIITAKQVKTYRFCVESRVNITAQIKSHTDSCTCPVSYANHQVVVSRSIPLANTDELMWRFKAADSTGSIQISGADTYTKPGPYYMNVIANCVSDAECGNERCTCAPCSNLPLSPYTLYIGPSVEFNNGKSVKARIDACAVKDVTSGLAGECFEVCQADVRTVYAYTATFLPVGIQVAISLGCMALVLLVLGCYWRLHFQTYTCCNPLVSHTIHLEYPTVMP